MRDMKRVIAYIDGYNLYYGLLKGTPYKWLGRFEADLNVKLWKCENMEMCKCGNGVWKWNVEMRSKDER